MKTTDEIAAEAAERVRERFKIDAVAALHGSLQSIIKAAIEKAVTAERDDRISWQELYERAKDQLVKACEDHSRIMAVEREKIELLEAELNEAVKLLKLADIDAAISKLETKLK